MRTFSSKMKLQQRKARKEQQMRKRAKEVFILLPSCLLTTNFGSLMGSNANQCVSVSPECPQVILTSMMTFELGSVHGDWLSQAKPDIEARMAQYEEGHIEFAILSLVRDPLLEMIPALAENVNAINVMSNRLDAIKPGWKDLIDFPTNGEVAGKNSLISDPNLAYGLTQDILDRAGPSQAVINLCHSDVASDILAHREQLITVQVDLRMSIKEEMQSNKSDEERAAARTCDYGARMQNFVRKMRVKKQSLEEA